ncbi:hypothetical protein BV898_19882 [Hypsibius exemplaris]|uniref:Uncharacterized protein n=1 Tax=Hypsibius exemplaris TaxID=2072580 RepID=A0A9X6NRT2_HYPEX|nr:hypothetical protein BV898_19882 [Hypsibius exemplaris]
MASVIPRRGTPRREEPPDTELIKLIEDAIKTSLKRRLTIAKIVAYIVNMAPTRNETGLKDRVDNTLVANEGTHFRRPQGHTHSWELQDIEGLRALSTQLLNENRRLSDNILTKQDIEGLRADYTQLLQEKRQLEEKNQGLDAVILARRAGALQISDSDSE